MTKKALLHLSLDPIMKGLIEIHDKPTLNKSPDLFSDLISSIISQQLSVKAAATIQKRFLALFDNKFPTPEQILQIPDEKIRECGISFPKIKYIKGIATAVIEKQIDLNKIPTLSDAQVLEELIKLKGVGKWTAEMLLMFSLGREDIFSMGDLGLRTAVSKLYGVDRDDFVSIEKISLKWSPYRTSASRYLWKSLDNTPKK